MAFRRIVILAAAVSFAVSPVFGAAEKLDRDLEKALQSIRPMDPYNYTKMLASKEFAGRLTGHEGYTAAAKWAAGKFREWGLRPISPKEGYLQAYPSPYTLVHKAEMTLLVTEGKPDPLQKEPAFKEIRLEPEKDFLPLLFTASGSHTAGIVFAGWGISAPEIGYDDYAGLDVTGKFVLCFRGTPDDKDKRYQVYDEHRTRMKTAKQKGALGIIYLYPEPSSNPNGDWIEGFTPAVLSEKMADHLLKETGANRADLRKDLLTYKRPIPFALDSKIRLDIESSHFPDGVGYNIVGYAEGSDPKLKDECLVLGAHFDHDGMHMGLLFPGADDNASGSATVMEIAEAFSKLGKKPRRSVAFVLFGGEEMGLQGSSYFADHIPAQFQKADGMFNFDMTGEGDGTGGGTSEDPPEMRKCLEKADQYVNTLRYVGTIRAVGVRSSDFAPFFLKGIPCASFHSNGPHLHYHRTGDTIYRINPEIMADISRLAFLAAFFWADR